MRRYCNQAAYCLDMMVRIRERIEARRKKLLNANVLGVKDDVGQLETKENICRMIRQLRAELLELEGMIRNDK